MRCKELARLLGADGMELASWRERLAARLHLMLCVHCRRYAAQLRGLGRGFRDQPPSASTGAKEDLEDRILKKANPSDS